jgi:signal transduction histidine kinase
VALELAQVVAEFPVAASFAIAGGLAALREGRRRTSLNEAVHELRRPLQVLALSLPGDAAAAGGAESSLRLIAAAVDRLEREVNGGRALDASAPVDLRPVVEAAVERWQVHSRCTDRTLSLRWEAGGPRLRGDETELSQAVDNMISNAFEHGGGGVTVEVCERAGRLVVAVLDSACPAGPSRQEIRRSRWVRISGRARHGHGLRVVRRAAARHGGHFQLRRSPHGAEARLELPTTEEVR